MLHHSRLEQAISIHSLTRRLTGCARIYIFGRVYFNSQPHKEADCFIDCGATLDGNFNSQPHKEADNIRIQLFIVLLHFNSQPHKEADVPLTRLPAL